MIVYIKEAGEEVKSHLKEQWKGVTRKESNTCIPKEKLTG